MRQAAFQTDSADRVANLDIHVDASIADIPRENVHRLAKLCRDEDECATLIESRDGKSVFRIRLGQGKSLIVKLWRRSGLKALVRRLTHTSNLDRELRASERLAECDITVPRILGHQRLDRKFSPFTDVMVMEDMGELRTMMDVFKEVVKAGDDKRLEEIEDELVRMTAAMTDAGVYDPDHSMANVVVTEEGKLARIDFEVARSGQYGQGSDKLLGLMLARLIGTYIFTVQPHTDRVDRFTQRLFDQVKPSDKAISAAMGEIRQLLAEQKRQSGIDVEIRLIQPSDSADNAYMNAITHEFH